MAVNFIVALRVAEFAAQPLRRVAEAGDLLSDSASRLTVQARAANAALATLAVGADAIAIGFGSSAAKVENAIARLQTATETTTTNIQTALNSAKAEAMKFSESYSASTEEIIKAQFRLATAGVPVREQIAATQGAFKLSQATLGDFTDSAELLGSFLNTFGKTVELNYLSPIDKVTKITDVAALAVQKYQLDLENLNDSLKFLVGPASTLNLPIAEVFSFAGALNTAGFRGTLAGTAISNAFNKIDKVTENLNLDKSAFTDDFGNLKDFTSFLDELDRKTKNLTSLERLNLFFKEFDIRAGRAIPTLLASRDSVRDFQIQAASATNIADDLSRIIESTLTAKLQQLSNTAGNVATTIGGPLNEGFKVVVDGIKSALQFIQPFIERNSVLIASLIGVSGALLTGAIAVTAYSLAAGALGPALSTLLNSLAGATAGTAIKNFLSGFGSIITSSAKLIASFYAVYAGVQYLMSGFSESSLTPFSDKLLGIGLIAIGILPALSGIISTLSILTTSIYAGAVAIGGYVIAAKAWVAASTIAATATAIFASELAIIEAFAIGGASVGFFGAIAAGISAIAVGVGVLLPFLAVAAAISVTYELLADSEGQVANQAAIVNAKLEASKIRFESVTESSARYANQLKNLANISDGKVKNVFGAGNFGDLPFAKDASAALKNSPTGAANDLIDKSVAKIGGLDGILTQYAQKTGRSVESTLRLAKSIQEIDAVSGNTTSKLSDLSKAASIIKSEFDGVSKLIDDFGDGSPVALEAITTILSSVAKLETAQTKARLFPDASVPEEYLNDIKTSYQSIFETIENSLPTLSRSKGLGVAQIAEQFIKLKSQVKDFSSDSIEFKTEIAPAAFNLGTDIESSKQSAVELTTILARLNQNLDRIKVATKNIQSGFENAKLGGEAFSDAIASAEGKISSSKENAQSFLNLIQELEKRKDFFKADLPAGGKLIEELETFLNRKKELEVEIRTNLSTQESERVANAFKSGLSKTTNTIVNKLTEDLAQGLGPSVGDILFGKLDGGSASARIFDVIKKQIAGNVQTGINFGIADRFAEEAQKGSEAVRAIINKSVIGGTIFEDINNENFTQRLNEAFAASAPNLEKLGFGDLFDLSDAKNKLAETFADINQDIGIKLITGTNTDIAALRELRDVISNPATGFEGLTKQYDELTKVLISAVSTGASGAIREIENALKATAEQLGTEKSQNPAERFESAIKSSESSIVTLSDRLSTVFESLVPIGKAFSAGIVDTFQKVRDTLGVNESGEATNRPNTIEVKITNSAKTFNVNVEGSGSTGTAVLDDADIKVIVNKAREEILREVTQDLIDLENRLRGR